MGFREMVKQDTGVELAKISFVFPSCRRAGIYLHIYEAKY